MCAVLISGAVDRDFVIIYIVVIYYILVRTTIGLDLRTSSTINGWIGLVWTYELRQRLTVEVEWSYELRRIKSNYRG